MQNMSNCEQPPAELVHVFFGNKKINTFWQKRMAASNKKTFTFVVKFFIWD